MGSILEALDLIQNGFLWWVEELADLFKTFGVVSVSMLIKQEWPVWIEECAAVLQAGGLWRCRSARVWTVMGRVCDVGLFCRVIYLQVSMNEGLSYITSSVHITTTECVSTRLLICSSPSSL